MKRIAALDKELEKVKALQSVSTVNCAPIAVTVTVRVVQPSRSGPPLLTTSNQFVEPLCATSTAQPAHGFVLPGVSVYKVATESPLVGSCAAMTPNGTQGAYGPRKFPDLPVFGGHAELCVRGDDPSVHLHGSGE